MREKALERGWFEKKKKFFVDYIGVVNRVAVNGHFIDFNNAHVIDKGNFRVRTTLESWHTAVTSESDNNLKPLPR